MRRSTPMAVALAASLWQAIARCVLVLAALTLGGTVQAQAPEPLEEVTVAIPGHFPPQYVITEDGELSGFAVDIAERVAALAGIRFIYLIEENWQTAREAIMSGRAEVSINNGITEDRKALYDFTTPVETFRISIFVREDTRGIETLDDLAGRKVAVEKTHVGVRLLQPSEDIELLLTEDTPATLFALLSGQADAMVYAEPVMWKVAREARVDDRVKVVGKPLIEIKRAMAVRKGNPELHGRLDRAVRVFVATADYREIYAKWYGRPELFWTAERVLLVLGALLFLSLVVMSIWRHVSLFKLNQALSESENRFRSYFDLPLVGSAIYAPDKKWIQVNDKLSELLGYSREEFGRLTWVDVTHPDDQAENARLFAEALAGQRDTYSMDKRFVRKDGETIYASISVQCLRKPDGEPDYFILLVQDITERKQAESEILELNEELEQRVEARTRELATANSQLRDELIARKQAEIALRESEERQRLAIESAAFGTWARMLPDDRVVWDEGSEAIFGLAPGTFEGTMEAFLSRVHPEDRERIRSGHQNLMEHGEHYECDYRITWPDGSLHYVTSRASLIRNKPDSSERIIGMLQDTTDRKRAEQALHAAQEELVRQERLAALGQLTGTVSHELRNPLGAMRTAVAAIKKLTPGENPMLRSSVGIVDRSITRCDNIIGDLLDYSRVRPLERENTDAEGWLADLLDEYQLPAGVTLRRELAAGARVAIDHDRLRRALINVIDNACQAMVGPGASGAGKGEHVLTVATAVTADHCEIAIGDTGSGIARDDQDRIFEPLYSTKSFGVGLGLPLVKRVVEQHDGSIEVESEPGNGTRFVIRLPLAAALAEVSP